MLCERCNKKKATVFYRENINGRVRALRLCGDCTEALEAAGELEDMSAAMTGFASPFCRIDDRLYATPFRLLPRKSAGRTGSAPTDACPLCGATAAEIASTGKVGCARCYEVFGDVLAGAIHATHGQSTHAGRTSAGHRARKEKAERLARLKDQLKEAIASEQYETAVSLRDEIRALEAEIR